MLPDLVLLSARRWLGEVVMGSGIFLSALQMGEVVVVGCSRLRATNGMFQRAARDFQRMCRQELPGKWGRTAGARGTGSSEFEIMHPPCSCGNKHSGPASSVGLETQTLGNLEMVSLDLCIF